MTDVIIIEKSFLIRFALKQLIQEITARCYWHELTGFEELRNIGLNTSQPLLIINTHLLPSNYKILLDKMNFPGLRVVLFSYDAETKYSNEMVIYLDEGGKDILEKLKSVLVQEPGKIHDSKILSERETDVLRCVALGMTNREIADRLFLSTHTVITHRKNISAKLGIKTIAGFTMYALLNNIIMPNDVATD